MEGSTIFGPLTTWILQHGKEFSWQGESLDPLEWVRHQNTWWVTIIKHMGYTSLNQLNWTATGAGRDPHFLCCFLMLLDQDLSSHSPPFSSLFTHPPYSAQPVSSVQSRILSHPPWHQALFLAPWAIWPVSFFCFVSFLNSWQIFKLLYPLLYLKLC